jgi:hypothetical protein
MSNFQFSFDKKQVPQLVGMGVLAAGLFGYFTWRVITPPPAERVQAAVKIAVAKVVNPGDDELAELTGGFAPTLAMRDPFISVIQPEITPAALPAQPVHSPNAPFNEKALGSIPPLPYSNEVRPLAGLSPNGIPSATAPLPTGPTTPPWSVTGILSGPGPGNQIAVLRDGDARRFVPLGGMVDSQFRLIGVDRYGVTLKNGSQRFRITLGSAKSKSASSATPAPDSGSVPGGIGTTSQGLLPAQAADPAARAPSQEPASAAGTSDAAQSGTKVPAGLSDSVDF